MRGLKRLVTSSVVSGLVASLFLTTNVFAAGIGGRPALPRDNEPRSQSIFVHTIKPGQTIPEKVLLSNHSDTPQTVLLYPVDAIPSNTGSFTCKQRAEAIEEAGGWIKLEKNEVRLAPNQTDIVDFTISAPETADVGEHNACLAFETKGDDGEINGNLRIRTRSAIRVALTIPGKLHREVKMAGYNVTQDIYRQRYTVTLNNTGNVSADTDVQVTLKSLFGGTLYTNGGQYPVLAGKKLELSYENTESPFFGGWYVASASAAYDKDATKWGTQRAANLVTVHSEDKIIFIMPQPLALVIMIALLALIIWGIVHLLRRESQRREVYRSWKAYRIQPGDTLQKLSRATDTPWKRIAKVNQLKAPYDLIPGKVIHLPKAKPTSKSDTRKR